jgi:hypothetical protein
MPKHMTQKSKTKFAGFKNLPPQGKGSAPKSKTDNHEPIQTSPLIR